MGNNTSASPSATDDRDSDIATYESGTNASDAPISRPPPLLSLLPSIPPELFVHIFSFLPLGSALSFQRSTRAIFEPIRKALELSEELQSMFAEKKRLARQLNGTYLNREGGEGCFAKVVIETPAECPIDFYDVFVHSRYETSGMGWTLENLTFRFRCPVWASEIELSDTEGDDLEEEGVEGEGERIEEETQQKQPPQPKVLIRCEVTEGRGLADSYRDAAPPAALSPGPIWVLVPLRRRVEDGRLQIQLSPFSRFVSGEVKETPEYADLESMLEAMKNAESSVFQGTRIHCEERMLSKMPLFAGNGVPPEPILMERNDDE